MSKQQISIREYLTAFRKERRTREQILGLIEELEKAGYEVTDADDYKDHDSAESGDQEEQPADS